MSDYEEGILRSLRRITRAIDLYSRQLAGKHGLTGPQLVCLRALRRDGVIAPSVLAREVELSQATVTGIIDRLVASGLVVRTRYEEDRRRVAVSLTEKGKVIVDNAPSPLHDRFVERFKALSTAEQEEIATTLQKVVHMMDADELDVVPLLTTGPVDASAEEVAQFMSTPES